MTNADCAHWNHYYEHHTKDTTPAIAEVFDNTVELFPTTGHALELACGTGQASLWFALHGLTVHGVDISPVAIKKARQQARIYGIEHHCRFDVVDLDNGLPQGHDATIVYCYRFRDRRLDQAIMNRLTCGGILAIACLSVVGGKPGPFRAQPGELTSAFSSFIPLSSGEENGLAWLVARKPS